MHDTVGQDHLQYLPLGTCVMYFTLAASNPIHSSQPAVKAGGQLRVLVTHCCKRIMYLAHPWLFGVRIILSAANDMLVNSWLTHSLQQGPSGLTSAISPSARGHSFTKVNCWVARVPVFLQLRPAFFNSL